MVSSAAGGSAKDGSVAGGSVAGEKTAPIGVFDSGVGGLTVARAIIDQLPHEALLFVGDGAHGPYGNQSMEAVQGYAVAIGDYLVDQGCKAIVMACNTATAAAYETFQKRYSIPIVQVITPAVRRAVATTRSGKVGVIATQATVDSGAYAREFERLCQRQPECGDVTVLSVACPRFVDFIERGVTTGRQVLGLAEGYLSPLQEAGVDTLVLGCTHYPLLSGIIQMAVGMDVALINSAEETTKDLVRFLTEQDLLAPTIPDDETGVDEVGVVGGPLHRFETTGDPVLFEHLTHRFLGPVVGSVEATRLLDY